MQRTSSAGLCAALILAFSPLSAAAQTYSRTDTLVYSDNLSRWVLGQQVSSTNANSGVTEFRVDYDPSTAAPLRYYGPGTASVPGLLEQRLSYNTDGTVATATDANGHVVSLSDWYRGIPRTIGYPATSESPSGTTQRASVNAQGWITSLTDESGATTCYGYDVMGRVNQITYSSESSQGECDTGKWNATSQRFAPAQATEHGLAPGHWTLTVATGNARKITYYDGQWRPVLTEEYDTANAAETRRYQRLVYDAQGRATFVSYPAISDASNQGTWTTYDALGRVIAVAQDTELSPALQVTTTEYLTGFQTRVTNPRGAVTTTSFLNYDAPREDWPALIDMPESARTVIARDPLGKPVSITRQDSAAATQVARTYTYDGNQRLCKSVEPETGATVFGYDAAGNLVKSAAGVQGISGAAACNQSEAWASGRLVNRSYDARNRLSALTFPDGRGDQVWQYTPDGLPAQVTTYNVSGGDSVVNAYSYNHRRLLAGESIAQPGLATQSLGYGYDANGALAAHTYPSGTAVTYAPNALGQATQAGAYATSVKYYPNGAIKQFTYGNGIVHNMTQNLRQLPARSTDTGGGAVLDMAYGFDANANVVGITDYVDGRQTRSMGYDGLDRLLTTQSVMFGGDNQAIFTYDALDNLRSFKVGAGRDYRYTYNTHQQLETVSNSAGGAAVIGLGYDAQGNVVNRNGQVFDFDYGNRLRAATNKEAYRYDAQGRRVRASAASGNIFSFYGQDGVLRAQQDRRIGKNSEYIYLGGSLVARISNAPSLPAPTLTAPSYSTQSGYSVSWTTTPSANRYELQEQGNGGAWTSVYSGAATSYTVSGKADGAYGYHIRACLNAYCGSWSTATTVAVQLPPTSAPGISVPATALNGNFTVSWTSVASATSYTLEQSKDGAAWSGVYSGAALSKAFSNVGAGTFSYRVKACNPAGCAAYSVTGTVTPLYPPGAAATPSVPASSGSGSYTVNWSAVATATRYELEESVSGGGFTQVQNSAATSRAVSGKSSNRYTYRLRACNDAGCGGYSGEASVQVTLPPASAPALSAPASGGTGTYTVSWSAVAGATSYQLEESANGGGWSLLQASGATSLGFAGKAPGSYTYRVRACNVGGCGAYSGSGTTTVEPPYPPTPASLTANYSVLEANRTRYAVRWASSTGASSYELRGFYSYTGPNTAANKTDNHAPTTNAAFSVRACNSNGCSPWSAYVTVQSLD